VVQAWRGRSGRLLHMPKPPATWSGRELVEPRWGTAVEDWGASLYETRHLVRSVLSIGAPGGGRAHFRALLATLGAHPHKRRVTPRTRVYA
jgi:hypothetical protein